MNSSPGWQARVGSALGVILLTAVVARAVDWLLAPLLPVVAVGALLLGLYLLIFGQFRR